MSKKKQSWTEVKEDSFWGFFFFFNKMLQEGKRDSRIELGLIPKTTRTSGEFIAKEQVVGRGQHWQMENSYEDTSSLGGFQLG